MGQGGEEEDLSGKFHLTGGALRMPVKESSLLDSLSKNGVHLEDI